MKVEIPIKGKKEVIKEILERTPMPTEGWLDIADGINAKFDTSLLAGAVWAILEEFKEMGEEIFGEIEVIVTAAASGNVLALLGVPIAQQLRLAADDIYALTFRRTEATEAPMFDLFRAVRSASHKDMVKIMSVRRDFVGGKRVLMIDDVIRDGGTAEAIKKMVEDMKGTFLGLGVIFRKMWFGKEQKDKLGDTPVVSLIDVDSPYLQDFEKFKKDQIKKLSSI